MLGTPAANASILPRPQDHDPLYVITDAPCPRIPCTRVDTLRACLVLRYITKRATVQNVLAPFHSPARRVHPG
eukprot:512458-Amphidinium_carterae.1